MGFGTAHCASKGGRGEAQGDAESKKGEGARHTTHKVGVGGCVGGEESLHTGARPPKDGTGSESSPNSGIAANGVGTAMIALREAFINSGKDGQTGIDGDGRPRASATGDERLISKGCHLCGGGSADRHNRSRHEDTIACGVVGSGPQYAE